MKKYPTIVHQQERKCKNGHTWILVDHLNNNNGWLDVTTYGPINCPECHNLAKEYRNLDPISGRPYSPTDPFHPIELGKKWVG